MSIDTLAVQERNKVDKNIENVITATFRERFYVTTVTFHERFCVITATFHERFYVITATFHERFYVITATFHERFYVITATLHERFCYYSHISWKILRYYSHISWKILPKAFLWYKNVLFDKQFQKIMLMLWDTKIEESDKHLLPVSNPTNSVDSKTWLHKLHLYVVVTQNYDNY